MKKLTEQLVNLEHQVYTVNLIEHGIARRDQGLDKELIKKMQDVLKDYEYTMAIDVAIQDEKQLEQLIEKQKEILSTT